MKYRCDTSSCKVYHYYGARGITYHKDFKNYAPFRKYMLSIGYTEGTSLQIDRIDNDGDYTYGNLRMVTSSQNMHNRSEPAIWGKVNYKGVSLDNRTGRYRAVTTVKGKTTHIGYFKEAEEANQAVIKFKESI